MRDDLEVTKLHRSLLVPVLVLGVERQLAGLLLAVAAVLVFAPRLNAVTPVVAGLMVAVGLPALRRLARRDPWTFRVLRAHLATAGFYPAQARHDVARSAPPTFR